MRTPFNYRRGALPPGNQSKLNVTNKKNGVSLFVKNVRAFNWFISEAPALLVRSLMTSQGGPGGD